MDEIMMMAAKIERLNDGDHAAEIEGLMLEVLALMDGPSFTEHEEEVADEMAWAGAYAMEAVVHRVCPVLTSYSCNEGGA